MSTEKESHPEVARANVVQEEDISSTHAHKCFPNRQPIRRSVTSFKRSGSSNENTGTSLILLNQRLPLYAERSMHLYLPRLTFDNSTYQSKAMIQTKPSNCSYVANNKFYLRKKGINFSDLYSLKHNRRGTNGHKFQNDKSKAGMTKFAGTALPIPSPNNASHTSPVPWDITSILWLNGSRQTVNGSPMYVRLMRGLERENKIPGHVRAEDCSDNTLGKVLTKEHLENLLKQEKPVIPAAFYMDT